MFSRARLLMSIPGVGAIVSLTFASSIDDPTRFKSSKQIGAYFGLTPNRARPISMAASPRLRALAVFGRRPVERAGLS
jgi:transposase